MDDFRLTPEMIVANNYLDYDPEYCDGQYCCRDCDKCLIADRIREDK